MSAPEPAPESDGGADPPTDATPDGPAPRPLPPSPEAAGRPRRRPRKELPTPVQLGTRPSRLLLRGLFARCPACGGGHLFRRWFVMQERCPTCTLRFERIEGHWIGSLGLNTTVVFGVMLLTLLGITIGAYPDVPIYPMLGIEIALALFGPLLFFPSSRMLWTATDLLMRPLKPGEIDPRFVVVDPYRDRPPRGRR